MTSGNKIMKVHVVYAHPEPKSFCCATRDTVLATLSETGHQVSLSDLYAESFNPVTSADDFTVRRDPSYLTYALEQRHAIEDGTLAPDIDREVKRLLTAELLILVFPIFWFSLPAMLKGWIDRVFLSGLLYGGRRFYWRGAMAGRRALVVASMSCRRHMFGVDAVHGELEPMLRHLTRGTLGYVGYNVLDPFWAFHIPYITDDERRVELGRLRQHLTLLDTLPVLAQPNLASYDAQARPLSSDA